MTRAAIFARYSSENQREEPVEDQIEVCRRYAAQLGYQVVATSMTVRSQAETVTAPDTTPSSRKRHP